MAVSSDYLAWVVEQLNRVSTVTARRMFGGAGLYADGRFFAVVDDNTVYFRTGPDNVSQYQSRGMPTFQPPGFPPMKYHQVPAEILEQSECLGEWVRAAVAEAAAAKSKSRTAPRSKAVESARAAAPRARALRRPG